MTLEEIKKQLEESYTMQLNDDGSIADWLPPPRVKYADLPRSLKEKVRERFTVETITKFLQELYDQKDYDELFSSLSEAERNRILIRLRNIATYTIEYESTDMLHYDRETLCPYLYGKDAFIAVGNAFADISQRTADNKKPRKNTKSRAIANCEIVSSGKYQCVISDEKYRYALTTKRNKNAYITRLSPEYFSKLKFDNGILKYDDLDVGELKQNALGTYQDISDIDLPLLNQIYTATINSCSKHDTNTITVYIPSFCKEMGIDINSGNGADLMEKLSVFYNCVGVINGVLYALLVPIVFDEEKQELTLAVPFMLKLIDTLKESNVKIARKKTGEIYINPHHNWLVHSSIANERNKTAVELVYVITSNLWTRGSTPDCNTYSRKKYIHDDPTRITYSRSFRSLIDQTTLLKARIASYKKVNDKNKALQRAFQKAYRLIQDKTDAQDCFVDLYWKDVIPTMATLDDPIIFEFKGISAEYIATHKHPTS